MMILQEDNRKLVVILSYEYSWRWTRETADGAEGM